MLTTPRLTLRELTLADAPALHAVLSDPEAMRFYPHPFSMEETENWIRWNLRNYTEYGFGLWAVVRKEDGQMIGDCGLTMQKIDGESLPEIGYHIRRDLTRQGYATEAARACRVHALDTLGFPAVYSYMKAKNIPSRRVAEKNGMRLLKVYVDANGEEVAVYSCTRKEQAQG